VIIGLGTDIVAIARIAKALERTPALAKRILTETELEQFRVSTQPERFLAKRFAAKEAAVKALGTGVGNGVGWQHVETSHNELGRPLLSISSTAAQIAEQLGITHWHLSYTDEVDYVVAQVIAEGR
jgi:holo-[acyl-carrier protein] synthase